MMNRHKKGKQTSKHLLHTNRVTLQNLKAGDTATVVKLHGGPNFISKAESLGIRVGLELKVISAQVLRGPLIVQVGQTRLAIGHGMAFRIEVER
ncbi:MAG: FeoA family protein [Candidatus Cloacimonadales bacterium]